MWLLAALFDSALLWLWSQDQFNSVRFSQSCPTLCDPMDCSMPGFPVHHQLPKLVQTHVHWVSDAIQPSHPLLAPSPPAFNLSQHPSLFQWVSSSHQVAKKLEFQLQISPSNEYSGLISFRMDWFDLAVQETLKSLLQHQSFPFYCFPLFLCIVHLGRLSYLSVLFFGTLHLDGYIFLFFAFNFSSFLSYL